MSFYVTLPSDSSQNYFPDNKISNYITRLPQCIQLSGEWEVGLAEVNFPHTWYNVNSTNNVIEYELPGGLKPHKKEIPPGFYPTIQSILDALTVKELKEKFSFSFNEVTKRVKMSVTGEGNIILCAGMAELLGFDTMDFGSEDDGAPFTMESPYVPDPSANFRVLMLYTDIIEPQIVGDVYAPLLRIINVTGSDGDMVHIQYDKPHYLPVSRKLIETIEINIRTHLGSFVPFERGRSYVKLHFRQKQLA